MSQAMTLMTLTVEIHMDRVHMDQRSVVDQGVARRAIFAQVLARRIELVAMQQIIELRIMYIMLNTETHSSY